MSNDEKTPTFPGFAEEAPEYEIGPRMGRTRRPPPQQSDRVRWLLWNEMIKAGFDMKRLSLAIGKNATYLSQFFDGKPAHLPEDAREAIAAALNLSNPNLLRGDQETLTHAASYRFRFRLGMDGGEVPESEQFLYPAPPLLEVPSRGFMAQVIDDHANRTYPGGTILWAVPPADLGRPLKTGDRVVARFFTRSGSSRIPGDIRLMLVSLSADGYDIILQSSTNNLLLASVATLQRAVPAPSGEAISYTPADTDPAEILGVVVAAMPSHT